MHRTSVLFLSTESVSKLH